VGVGRGANNPTLSKKLLRSLQEIQPFLMEENCGGGQGLNWAVEPRRRRRISAQLLSLVSVLWVNKPHTHTHTHTHSASHFHTLSALSLRLFQVTKIHK
jgi:hypothetical protein